MKNIPEHFGELVFSDSIMQERLPEDIYAAMKRTIVDGRSLDLTIANVVADAMKDWAIEKGATHYTHWFQPMTGITAEKHDSFISPTKDGKIIMEFSGKELIKGEPDASSFPSGGLRATFEARGYTAWDPTSYAFIKDKTLCIPTAFCSYGGEALDEKTPLLRSMEAINRQAMRVLKLFGNDNVKFVRTTVGPEQEYFLIDKELHDRRKDLVYTGRTLFGAKPPKGQELDDHYFGAIKPKVAAFMEELNEELWKLGVLAKTEHNEGAPSQHELAPIFTTTNIAADHNQLTMEMMQKIAKRHGMICLLHEKPFKGVNGSGKHNNWSIATNTGVNLLTPGETPHENAQFLLFLCAVIQAADNYQDLLRISVASAGNDHRLGAHEAPPAVISMFLGDELNGILEALENDTPYSASEKTLLRLGVHTLPKLPKDSTDRNRTSPLAFTGNKFEFRMLGSASSVSTTNTVFNTAVAESLRLYADELELVEEKDFNRALHALIRRTIKEHKRIIFNGNGYNDDWLKEATENRKLLNLPTTADCVPLLLADKNVKLFEQHKVFNKTELVSRCSIMLENYTKVINIESLTMIEMTRRDILPAIEAFAKDTAQTARYKIGLLPELDCVYEKQLVMNLTQLCNGINDSCVALEEEVENLKSTKGDLKRAECCRDNILPVMDKLRTLADDAETLTSSKYWPFPTYGELLYGIR